MVALSWTLVATLLLVLQQNSLALPTVIIKTANTEHYRSNIVIEGQDSPPCLHNICPLLSVVVPQALPNSTFNATTILESNIHNHTNVVDAVPPGKQVDDDPDALIKCSSSAENKVEPDSQTSSYRSAKHQSIRAAYRIAGQAPPPCRNRICPLTQSRRSEAVEGAEGTKNPTSEDTNHPRSAFVIIGANQTVPPSCLNGKVRCLFKSNSSEIPQNHYSPKKQNSSSVTSACRINSTSLHLPTKQTAPITCGDGTKPPCGINHLSKDPKNHSLNQTSFPGTHQTAPITCGDGTKPPCGINHLSKDPKNRPLNQTSFPATHQTAPVTCGDGTKPPCGNNQSIQSGKHYPRAETARHLPTTYRTSLASCDDGTKPPCEKNHSGEGTTHRFPGTKQTAPISCGDGTKPPCEKNHSGEGTTHRFPGTKPISCGDGTKPPCGMK